MTKENFDALMIRLRRVLDILMEEGHPIEQQNARRAELRALVGMLKDA